MTTHQRLDAALSASDLEMNAREVEAFFLGGLSAISPMKLPKALSELFLEDTKVPVTFESADAKKQITDVLSVLWKELEKNLEARREKLLVIDGADLKTEITQLGRLGDFFLMGFTLAGESVDDRDDEAGELLDELEDHLLLFDEWVADGESRLDQATWTEEGQKYRRELAELWGELCEALA